MILACQEKMYIVKKSLKEILETLDRNAYSFYDYVMEHENALFVDYL